MAVANIIARLRGKNAAAEKKQMPPRRYVLSGPLLLALGLVLVCAVAWAFFMGLMVGRGQSPQAEIHAMTGMLAPEEETSAPDASFEEGEGASGRIPPLPEAAAAGAASSVHAPPQGQAMRAWPQEKPGQTQAQPARPQARRSAQAGRAEPKADPNQRFSYSFQVAAFKTRDEAQNAQKELIASGYRASFRKSGNVYLVLVNLRGSQNVVDKFQATLKKLRLGKPLQLSRKPVQGKAESGRAN